MTASDPPGSTTIGYGTAHPNAHLDVSCGRCHAAVGQPCTRRGGGSHTTRQDKARRKQFNAAHRLAMQREQAALRADPDGPLWRAVMSAHHCGAHGPHRIPDDCRPIEETE